MMNLAQIRSMQTMFGFDAVTDKGRRKAPETRSVHENRVLTIRKRKRLQATAQDQVRNLSLAAWMVRRQIAYVSRFHVSFRTGKPGIDELVNRLFKWHGRPVNFDYGRKHGRDEMFDLYEREKITGGDAALLKLDDLKLQAIESDMIAKGEKRAGTGFPVAPKEVTDEGLILSADGAKIEQFAICNRGTAGKDVVFDHMANWDTVIFDAYYDRLSSQNRGTSPLSTAINTLQDTYEGLEYNQVKAKMHALFGIALIRGPESANMGGASGVTAETENQASTSKQTELDIDPTDINLIDLNVGEKIETIESGTPSTEFVNGSYLFIQIAMLALDIPVTAFDSRRSSFSARIADLNEYEVSVESKRTKNRYVRKEYSDWLIDQTWNDPNWRIGDTADRAGMTKRDVQEALEWIPSGSPWLDKLKQVKGDELAIDLRLDNALDAARRRGGNVYRNIDKQLEVEKYEMEQRALKGLPEAEPQEAPTAAMSEDRLADIVTDALQTVEDDREVPA